VREQLTPILLTAEFDEMVDCDWKARFRDYATALHELTHWTKHKDRLERDFSAKRFGDGGYAR